MVNITTRVIDKKKKRTTWPGGRGRGWPTPMFSCSLHKASMGRKGFIQCHRPSLREAIKGLQAGTEALSTWRDSTHWLALHGLLDLFSYITWDYLPRSGPNLDGRPTHFKHKSIKCPTDMPKGQSDGVNSSIEISFVGDSCLCKGNKNQPERHACILALGWTRHACSLRLVELGMPASLH